ncbi:wax ester synthase/diacylglycerol acyltransferase 4-like [Salvia miltiorrhiza]|uniref:wax ester synthase/diacylglycerol acyltransferase 4-like n=1 Tax=Salvia miltiorrhiza TaxID=226208 RepID=UPI0025AD66CD|nr:wax ester synthase/diacylglycerol acyltransferase 4-like [Salvia miltiorrhiza]
MEEHYSEPVSPTGQYFTSSVISVSVIGVLESEIPIDNSHTFSLLKDLFLPINPRFSSLMVKDKNGKKHWKKVDVKLEDHLNLPKFPAEKSPEFYEECLTDYLSRISMEEFPQSRPLWEIHIIQYPTKNAKGSVVFKLHHSLGDGFSLMGALLSCLQRADDPQIPLTLPSMIPTGHALGSGHGFCRRFSRVLSGVVNTVVDFGWSLLKSSVLEDHKSPVRSGEDGVEFRPITITTLTFSLDQIRQIKASLHVSINDVVCGVVFLGIRMYMQAMKQELTNAKSTALVLLNTRNIRTYKTISEMVEPDDDDSSWGNRFAFLHVPLPRMAADPLSFVLKANKLVRRKKNSAAIILTGKLLDALRKLRGPEVTAKYIHSTLKNTSMTVSNIMGPVEKMALSNHPIKGLYFMVVGVPQNLTITMVSYMGRLRVALGTEKGMIDSPKLKSCLQNAFDIIFKSAISSTA